MSATYVKSSIHFRLIFTYTIKLTAKEGVHFVPGSLPKGKRSTNQNNNYILQGRLVTDFPYQPNIHAGRMLKV